MCLGQHILDVHYSDNIATKPGLVSQHSGAILALGSLIKQDSLSLLPYLPRLVETIVRSLDPHVPFLRTSCLSATTQVLHSLVRHYPMVSFHQESQRLAVGTKDSVIVIYDLKTATRWHVLEIKQSSISAIAFSPTGSSLVSYSIGDKEIRFWKTTTSFLGIFGSTPHCTLNKKIEEEMEVKSLAHYNILETVKIKWKNETEVELFRTYTSPVVIKNK